MRHWLRLAARVILVMSLVAPLIALSFGYFAIPLIAAVVWALIAWMLCVTCGGLLWLALDIAEALAPERYVHSIWRLTGAGSVELRRWVVNKRSKNNEPVGGIFRDQFVTKTLPKSHGTISLISAE